MRIFKAYEYLLYRIYQWQLDWFGKDNSPKFVAIIGGSLLLFINILTVLVIIRIIFGYKIPVKSLYIIIFMIISISLNSYIFLHLNKFENVIAEFAKETKSQRNRNKILCLAYVFFSYSIFFILMSVFP